MLKLFTSKFTGNNFFYQHLKISASSPLLNCIIPIEVTLLSVTMSSIISNRAF